MSDDSLIAAMVEAARRTTPPPNGNGAMKRPVRWFVGQFVTELRRLISYSVHGEFKHVVRYWPYKILLDVDKWLMPLQLIERSPYVDHSDWKELKQMADSARKTFEEDPVLQMRDELANLRRSVVKMSEIQSKADIVVGDLEKLASEMPVSA